MRLKCECGECKTCRNREYQRDYYRRKHPTQTITLQCRICGDDFTTTQRMADRPHSGHKYCSESCRWRAKSITDKGLSVEQYQALDAAQDSRCAICKRLASEDMHKKLVVDHDHSCCPGDTGCQRCIRGLLCVNCNSAIGLLQDDTNLLDRAKAYLTQPQPLF